MKKSIFLFFAAILCSVSAWAFNITANNYVYFEKPSDWSNVSLLLGHNTWSQGYNFTKISNTNLYYWKTPKWDNATEYYFIDATGWGGEGKKPTDRKGYASHASVKFITNFSKYHLFTSSKEVKKDASSYATAVNRTQNIKVQLKDGSNWVDATVVPADLTASTYALTSATAAGAKSASLAKESTTVYATVDAAYSATVSLSCTNVLDGYMFEGWYDANGNKITSYTVSDAHTVYARFIQSAEETNEVSVTYMCDATSVATAINEIVGVESEKSFTAPTVTGYKFANWTIGAGIDLKAGTASDATITVVTKSASSDYTLVANYEEVIETIYFINTGKWSVVNLHRWNGTATASAWPGTPLTAIGEKIGEYDVYSFTAKQGDFANVIFTNKNTGSDQTVDLTWTANKYYIYNYGGKSGWYTKAEAEELLVVPVVEETVYFVNNKKWTKVQAYAWNSSANNGWPGVALTATGEKVAGFDVYSYTAPQGYVNVIFNNKTGETGVQSADFVWTNGKYYYMDAAANYAGGTKEEVEAVLAVPVVTYDYYIAGSMNGWATNKADYGMALVDGVYKKEVAFAKDAEFKVTNGTDWCGFSNVDANYQGVSDKDGNIKVDAAATFTVVFNKTTKKISFEGLTKIEDIYSIKGVDALGLNWKETDTKDDMTKQGDGTYTLLKSNITLAVGNYEYKAIKNHSWDWKAINSGNNLTLHVDKSGRYNITFTLNAEATEVTYTLELLEEVDIVPDCFISGNKNLTGKETEWQGDEFKMEYDDVKKLHYYTFDLKKDKTYELKAVCNDTWFGYDKLGAYYAEVTNKDGGIQVKLTADASVTVWFDYKTSMITFEGLTIKTFKDITFTITATSTPKIYWWNGGDKLADANWGTRPEMILTANPNEYTYTLKDVDESTGVEYLITIGTLQTANQKTKVDVVANFKDLLTQVKVMGDFVDDWKTPFVMTIADDYKTASITMALGAKTYNFKVVEGDAWLGNSGTITKTVSGWTFEGEKENCKIQTSIAGNYIFTWNFENNKLSVSYPVKVTPFVESGIFSVADGKFVQFSTGNLQYEVETNKWSFAENQYDYVGEANINVGDPSYTGKIDMFGWSADGKFGVNPSNKNEDYYGTFQDWGTLVDEADWYTLSADEWKYLLNTRANAANLKQIAKVDGVVGIMLFPDVWTMPKDVNVTAEYDSYFEVNIYNYTLEQWEKLETVGAVFLPAAGRRAGGYGNMINKDQVEETKSENLNGGHYKHYDNGNIYCYYWTSTINESTKNVSFLHNIQALGGDKYTIGTGAVWGEKGRYGQSVRLVKKATPDYERTVTSGDYGTICLPNGGLLLGASAFSVAGMEGTTILLDEVGTTMVGGTPYVVFPNTGASNLYVFYTDNANAPAGDDNGLYGSYERRELEANVGNYIMLPGNRYAEVTGDRVFVAANRAYFMLSKISTKASAPAPGVRRIAISQAPQVATGMESVDASTQPVKMIIDGQLYILRGEKMYDAQGKLVK